MAVFVFLCPLLQLCFTCSLSSMPACLPLSWRHHRLERTQKSHLSSQRRLCLVYRTVLSLLLDPRLNASYQLPRMVGFFNSSSQLVSSWSTARGQHSCSPSLPRAVRGLEVGKLRALYGWRLLQLCKAVDVFTLRFLQQLLIMFFPVSIAQFVAAWGWVNARAFHYFSKFSSRVKADSLFFLWHFDSLSWIWKASEKSVHSKQSLKRSETFWGLSQTTGLALFLQSSRLFLPFYLICFLSSELCKDKPTASYVSYSFPEGTQVFWSLCLT